MLWDPDKEGPEALLEELHGTGVRAGSLEVDLSLPESPEEVLDAAGKSLGLLSILVNNAVHSERDGYEKLAAATLDAHYAVNLRAAALLATGLVRRYIGESGRIVNLASGPSLGPMMGELSYAATKGAIEAFTTTLAAEVGHRHYSQRCKPWPDRHRLDGRRATRGTSTEVSRRTPRDAGGCG